MKTLQLNVHHYLGLISGGVIEIHWIVRTDNDQTTFYAITHRVPIRSADECLIAPPKKVSILVNRGIHFHTQTSSMRRALKDCYDIIIWSCFPPSLASEIEPKQLHCRLSSVHGREHQTIREQKHQYCWMNKALDVFQRTRFVVWHRWRRAGSDSLDQPCEYIPCCFITRDYLTVLYLGIQSDAVQFDHIVP